MYRYFLVAHIFLFLSWSPRLQTILSCLFMADICNSSWRTGRGGPPIRAVCRHEFEQRVDIIRARHNTCLNNTNLGSVTAVNGKKTPNLGYVTGVNGYGSRKISPTTSPPTESIRAKLGLPPQMDVGPYADSYSVLCIFG